MAQTELQSATRALLTTQLDRSPQNTFTIRDGWVKLPHYATIIDLFSAAGEIADAEEVCFGWRPRQPNLLDPAESSASWLRLNSSEKTLTPTPPCRVNLLLLASEDATSIERDVNSVITLVRRADYDAIYRRLASSSTAEARDKLLAKLRVFGAMQDGWDGDHASRLQPAAVDQARAFIGGFSRVLIEFGPHTEEFLPEIDPSPDGFITLYWMRPNLVVTCDFRGDGVADWYASIAGNEYQGSEPAGDEWKLPPQLRGLLLKHVVDATR